RTPLAALTALGLIGLTPQPARADPLTASLVYQVEDSSISARELVPIDRKVTGTFEFYRNQRASAAHAVGAGGAGRHAALHDRSWRDQPADVEQVGQTAATLLNRLMGERKPCTARAKLQIRGDLTAP